jgi:hypothetical protein
MDWVGHMSINGKSGREVQFSWRHAKHAKHPRSGE